MIQDAAEPPWEVEACNERHPRRILRRPRAAALECDKIQFNVSQDEGALGNLMQINHAVFFGGVGQNYSLAYLMFWHKHRLWAER